MVSIEGLSKVNQSLQNNVEDVQKNNLYNARQEAAQQAAGFAKTGDWASAYGTMISHDPENAGKYIQQASAIDPVLGQKLSDAAQRGQLGAQTDFGSNPNQLHTMDNQNALDIAKIHADAQIKAGQMKSDKPVIRADANSPTGFSMITPQGVVPFDAYGSKPGAAQPTPPAAAKPTAASPTTPASTTPTDASTKAPASPTPEATPTPAPVTLRPNEDIDSNGKRVLLSPRQQTVIKETRKTFDSETKDIVKGLDAAHQGKEMVNNPDLRGVEALERLRILRSVVQNRVSNQEFQAYGGDMGLVTSLENKLQKLKDGKLTPEMRKIYSDTLSATEKALGSEFDTHLKNAVERNPEVDPFILKKRLVGSGPTAYQAIAKKVSQMPEKDQAAFNWAHDNDKDPKAKAIMEHLNQEYKLDQ